MKKIAFLVLSALSIALFSCKKECTEAAAYTQDADGNCQYRQTFLTGSWNAIEYKDGGACGSGNMNYSISTQPLNAYSLMQITIVNLGNLNINATATLFNNDNGAINIIIDNQTQLASGNTYNIYGTGIINPNNTAISINYTILQQNGPTCIYDYAGNWYRQ